VIENPYYSQEGHGPYELHDIGGFDLEEGWTIRGCGLAVATHGKLNAAKTSCLRNEVDALLGFPTKPRMRADSMTLSTRSAAG
jgi:hypothetical protein